MTERVINRYSDAELSEFKAIIDQKLEKARKQFKSLDDQVTNITEKLEEDGDWMEGSGSHVDLEFLQSMAQRQLKHIQDLENALLRIRHKNYGICSISGQLIDKRRLMAVPTTTKSIAAKTMIQVPEIPDRKPIPVIKKSENQIITKIIRPAKQKGKFEDHEEEEFDDYENDYLVNDENDIDNSEIDFDSFPAT
ncbi:hypothetical protein OAF63_01980 [Saprospiraceae bacterium]|jgi:RNA polymerase-binding transcription factor DksA|nr:hypothetical protein [Bacteroidota bacterium]MDB4727533.1 hypothetical protein [Saprospiraceae bacterium]MDF1866249.1 hypothetical protein [Saprospiraceae bacterium]